MQVVRYLRRWVAAAKISPEGRGGWLFLVAFCLGLGFLLAMFSVLGVTPHAELAKSIASLFCVSPIVTNTPAS